MKAFMNITTIACVIGVVVTTAAFAGGYDSFVPAIIQNLLFGFIGGYAFRKSSFVA